MTNGGHEEMSEIHALSGAYAVDALDDIERAQFERHLATCAGLPQRGRLPARGGSRCLRRPRRSRRRRACASGCSPRWQRSAHCRQRCQRRIAGPGAGSAHSWWRRPWCWRPAWVA